ncbi:hypothetical protein BDZ91DRAFT_309340 [Kalaharituber pfeilii]|nr:hypothetical protein BDZ91DRAFT_309340 [Kalaharituber pfeilii]
MAQQSIVNVDSQVEQSVVDSTTGVDVSKTVSSVTTSGGKLEESHAEITAQDVEVVKSQNGDIEAGGNSILDSNRSADYARTNTPGVGESVESDGDVGSGSGSPSKGLASDANAKTTTRPTSVKKIQSFKAVSINRQYLEKASSSGPVATVPKTVFSTDRSSSFVTQATSGGSSTLSFAKPRLVAKSTSGLRDSSPGTGLGTISTGSAKNAVEAQRAVWNKNQPPPVIPQKEMSDEELQKNYGIHLASRLQSDDTNKETKWADEDDDDDWVPEAIEWNDGTKVALQPEPSTAKSTEKEPSGKTEEKPSEPKTLVFTRDPGKIAGSGDKGVPKDAPQPRSSPWAPVPQPNVVPIKPPSESRSSDYGSQHQGSSREAHSDEFNRSWRDRPMNSRELFNSETGQLEPVQDRRNRALRNSRGELQSIKTQVLQRPPSQLSGPEPSPAFQQNRSGSYRQDDYRRRRTSSNVSGGSGSTGRRLSFNKGMHGLDHPLTPEDSSFSPRNVLQESVHPPQQSQGGGIDPLTPQSATVPAAAPVIVEEDPIAMQQRVMKEARELARKRKQEEEEREEAAKKERLRLKLAELEAKAAKAVAEKEAAEKAAAEKAAAEAAAAEAAAAEREAEAARAVAAEKDAAARAADEAALQAGAADIQAQGGSAADTTSTTMTVTQQPSAMAPATLPSPNPQQYAGPSPTARIGLGRMVHVRRQKASAAWQLSVLAPR